MGWAGIGAENRAREDLYPPVNMLDEALMSKPGHTVPNRIVWVGAQWWITFYPRPFFIFLTTNT